MTPVDARGYNSPVRREQATRTRQRILNAAAVAGFPDRGHGATSIRAIAEAAQVAPDTVYATFGSKARLLTALIDNRLAPGGESSILDRPQVQMMRDERDPRRFLRLFARDYATMAERVRPVSEVLRTAKAAEPEMAAVRDEIEGYRFQYGNPLSDGSPSATSCACRFLAPRRSYGPSPVPTSAECSATSKDGPRVIR